MPRKLLVLVLAVLFLVHFESPARAQSPGTAELVQSNWHADARFYAAVVGQFSGDGRLLLTGGSDRSARLWEAATGRKIRQFAHLGPVTAVAFSPAPNIAATAGGGYDKSVRIWNLATGEMLKRFVGEEAFALTFISANRLAVGETGAIRIIDTASGAELTRIKGEHFRDMVISPDKTRLLTASIDYVVQLWDLSSGKQLAKRKGALGQNLAFYGKDPVIANHDRGKKALVVSHVTTDKELLRLPDGPTGLDRFKLAPDGRYLLTSDYESTLRLWDPSTGREVWKLAQSVGLNPYLTMFSPNGMAAVFDSDWQWHLVDLAKGRIANRLGVSSSGIARIAVLPAGSSVLSTNGDVATLWDLRTGRQLKSIAIERAKALSVSPDGKLALIGTNQFAKIVDIETGRTLKTLISNSAGRVNAVAFSPKSKTAFVADEQGEIREYDVANLSETTATPKRSLKSKRSVGWLDVSPDGRELIVGEHDGENVQLWDIPTGRQTASLGRVEFRTNPTLGIFSSNGRQLLVASPDNSVQLLDKSGSQLRRFVGHDHYLTSLAFSPDGRTVLTASSDGSARTWDTASGRERSRLQGHDGVVTDAAFASEGQTVVTAGNDGTLRVWDAATGAARATIASFKDGSWLVITPEGFFDSSSRGAANNLSIVRGLESASIDQVYDALYRPDLVREKLAGDPSGKVKTAAAQLDLDKVAASGPAPGISIQSHVDGASVAAGDVTVEAEVTDRGGGIGKIEWRLNGQTLGVETRGVQRVQTGSSGVTDGATLKVSKQLVVESGDNQIEVVAYNAKGLIASVPARIILKGTGSVAQVKPRLFVLAIGINDYLDSRLKLNFAAPDARAVAASFEKAGSSLYESVNVRTVLNEEATASKLDSVFRKLGSEIRASDVFVFFVAGHGRTLNGKYYFIPQDFRYRDQNSYVQSGISQEQWQIWISLVPARKSILIYDTCESGTVTADTMVVAARGTRQVEEQEVAYEKLRQATGRTILAASTDTQPALEGYRGHGVLSYAVMDAIQSAPVNAGGLIEVTSLIGHVDTKVPEFSYQAFKQRQFPQAKFSGSNFPIVQRTTVLAGAASAAVSAVPTKPTHVVIAPATVRSAPDARSTAAAQLPAGAQVAIVRREGGWTVVVRDGKELGYVEESALVALQ